MTHWTETRYQPTQIDMSCTNCGRVAKYTPAIIVKLTQHQRDHLPRSCDWLEFDIEMNRVWPQIESSGATVTLFFSDLAQGKMDGQFREHLRNSKFTNQRGTVRCTHCATRRKHDLNWPGDAYYKIEVRNQTLWAWNVSDAKRILEYIAADQRRKPRHDSCLAMLPAHFLHQKNRETVVKKLRAILESRD